MTDSERHALTELVTQFRELAEIERKFAKAESAKHGSPTLHARQLGKASAYADAANDLERILSQTDTEPHTSTQPADREQ